MSQISTQIINDFFSDLLGFESNPQIEATDDEIFVDLQLDPQFSGIVIGYRGEVLTAIQLLLSLMIQENHDNWLPVRVNVNDYRQQRQKALEELAQNTADKALKLQKPITLNNLSSYERRVIHTILSETPEITTFSEGEEPNRVLIISPA